MSTQAQKDAKLAEQGNSKLKETEVRLDEGQTKTVRKQKKSTSYALKALRTHVETLNEDHLMSDADAELIEGIVKKAAEQFIKREYGIG